MKSRASEWDAKIVSFIESKGSATAEQIAKLKGKLYTETWAIPRCKRLMRMKKIRLNANGEYVLR